MRPLEVALILKGLDAWKKSEQWIKGRVWDPVNFLNDRHWEDEISDLPTVTASSTNIKSLNEYPVLEVCQ